MLIDFIQHNWQYAVLILAIALYIQSRLYTAKVNRLYNSGRVTEIQEGERLSVVCMFLSAIAAITFVVVSI